MKLHLIVLLLCSSLALTQTTKPKKPATPTAPEPFAMNVFGETWEQGELRTCYTHIISTYLLICDDDKFVRLIAPYLTAGMSEKDAYREADIFASTHSKRFLVQFSKLPWPLSPPDPNRKNNGSEPDFANAPPDSSNLVTLWNCSKEKMITCSFGGTAPMEKAGKH
jgi:hypothetical protein